MIDFPSSPTVGQLYTAPNGVTYQWNGTLWLTNSAGGSGAVQAGGGTFAPATGVDVVINFPTVMQGNTGNWLNLVNGRYTPPAGRYFLQVTHGVQAPTGGNGTWTLKPRKNGVVIPNEGASASGGPQFSIPITVGVYVDANGTDYFEWVANCASAGMANQGGGFTAFPLSGLQGPPGPLGASSGDFCAVQTANFPPASSTFTTMILTQVVSGNAGNWYSPTTGRFTPPAGRYFIKAAYSQACATANHIYIQLRKNGVVLIGDVDTSATANYFANPEVSIIVDANGTDWFDVQTQSSAGNTWYGAMFMAFSTQVGPQGIQGPPGVLPPNALSLYQEVVLAANASNMAVSWPSGARKIEIEYLVLNAGNAVDTVGFRAMVNGVPNSAAGYNNVYVFGSGSTPSAGSIVASAQWQHLAGMIVTKGRLCPAVTAAQTYIEGTSWGSSASVTYAITHGFSGTAGAGMNGLQLSNTGGAQFAPGSFLRAYVVP
jgi:hypothetical protein